MFLFLIFLCASIFLFFCSFYLSFCFFFSSRRRHTRCSRVWSSDVCSSDLLWNNEADRRALGSAAKCGQGSPGIAHMWHMPGHTYSALHRYADGAWQQEAAARVDHEIGRASCRERV